MEGYEQNDGMDTNDRDEIYSNAVKAGKRTYFFDVKATRNNDYYLTITESKKKFDNNGNPSYEKHKVFLYKEDFEKFIQGLNEAVGFIAQKQGTSDMKAGAAGVEDSEKREAIHEEIKIDIDF